MVILVQHTIGLAVLTPKMMVGMDRVWVGHAGEHNGGNRSDPHDENGLIHVGCVWETARRLWIGGLWEQHQPLATTATQPPVLF